MLNSTRLSPVLRPTPSRPRVTLRIALAAAPLCTASVALAGLTFNTAPAPGGFLQAGAGPSTPGSNPWPGGDFTTLFSDPSSDVDEVSFSGDTSASASAMFSSGSISNACEGTVGLGLIDMSAVNDAPNSSSFAAAIANGGWSEVFTISNPALTGQSGFMQFTLDVSGWLFASGFAGSAGVLLTGYKDSAQLLANPYFSPVGPGPIGDLNGDGVVDGADLGLFLAAWGTPDGDLNGDGTTDGADLGILLSNWS